MRMKANTVVVSFRLPRPLIDRLKGTVRANKPAIKDMTHAAEIAITDWVERNEKK